MDKKDIKVTFTDEIRSLYDSHDFFPRKESDVMTKEFYNKIMSSLRDSGLDLGKIIIASTPRKVSGIDEIVFCSRAREKYMPIFISRPKVRKWPKGKRFKAAKIQSRFTLGQLKFADKDFVKSYLSSYLTPVWSITEANTPIQVLSQLAALGKRFDEALKKYDHKHHFTLGVDIAQATINLYNVSMNQSPPVGGCILNLSGYRERNFTKAYGRIVDEILAIRF